MANWIFTFLTLPIGGWITAAVGIGLDVTEAVMTQQGKKAWERIAETVKAMSSGSQRPEGQRYDNSVIFNMAVANHAMNCSATEVGAWQNGCESGMTRTTYANCIKGKYSYAANFPDNKQCASLREKINNVNRRTFVSTDNMGRNSGGGAFAAIDTWFSRPCNPWNCSIPGVIQEKAMFKYVIAAPQHRHKPPKCLKNNGPPARGVGGPEKPGCQSYANQGVQTFQAEAMQELDAVEAHFQELNIQ